MKLYLVRHGAAKSAREDPSLPLTDKARSDISHLGRTLSNMNVRTQKIIHSGKLRAEETAKILGDSFDPAIPVEQAAGLNPEDDITPALEMVNALEEDLMIVGHLPFLARLLDALTGLEGRDELPDFGTGTLVGVERSGERWQVFRHQGPNMIL